MESFEGIFISSVQAQETNTAGTKPAQGGGFQMFLPMILVFVIFYFLLIRPQSKQRKEHQKLIQNIKKGDEVVTASGIHGKITGVADNILTLEIADNVRIKMEKSQVATVKSSAITT